MIIRKIKKCNVCGTNCYLFSKGRCKPCSMKDIIKKTVNTSIKKIRKPTGELALFKEIYNERPDYCEICNEHIYEFNICNYHHIKPKGRFPELRLDKSNIKKICFKCHRKFHS